MLLFNCFYGRVSNKMFFKSLNTFFSSVVACSHLCIYCSASRFANKLLKLHTHTHPLYSTPPKPTQA